MESQYSLALMVDTIFYLYLYHVVRIIVKKMMNVKADLINLDCWCFNKYLREVTRVYKIGTRFDLSPSIISCQLFNLWSFEREMRAHVTAKS